MKILIVEDNQKLAASLKTGLESEGFAVDCLFDGETAERRILINRSDYDAIVLDVMLPGKDGVSVCRAWRAAGVTLPVIMLTAKDMTEDKVEGLSSGADDYLPKPFAFAELVARIRALLRREKQLQSDEISVGGLHLDAKSHSAELDGKPLSLTLKEFMVLEYLMRNRNHAVTRDTLYDHAWDYADSSLSNTVDVHIKNLRKKINDNGRIIQTVRGVGYKMAA